MSLGELLHEIEALPAADRRVLLDKLQDLTHTDVPESFRRSLAEAERGELIDLDVALQELERP